VKGVEDRPLAVAPGRRLEEEDGVGERRCREPCADQQPGPAGPPAGQREHADHGREEEDVAERVGEVDDDHACAAVGAAEHDLEQHRRAERSGGDGRHRAVEPERASELREPRAHEQHQADVAGWVEREVEHVGGGGIRRVGAVGEVEEELGNRPAGDRGGECDPGTLLTIPVRSAVDAGGEREQDQRVVEVLVEEIVVADPVADERVRDEQRQAGAGREFPGTREPGVGSDGDVRGRHFPGIDRKAARD
jgi:hypothetical protein